MRQFITSVARVVPVVLEHSALQVSLQGWPAAAAVAFVGATIVASVIVLSGSRDTHPAA